MKLYIIQSLLLLLAMHANSQPIVSPSNYVLVIHGGAGTMDKKTITPEQEAAYIAVLKNALLVGYNVLKAGGTSLDAVEKSVKILEDSPLFNAGKGSVFTHDGRIEMDAAIMSGSGKAGAVACVEGIKNPIQAARSVMENSPHVLLCGKGAEQFAKEQGLPFEDSSYFATEFRYNQLQRAIEADKIELDHQGTIDTTGQVIDEKNQKYGTVGAVALDLEGNLAAATSTGGLTNKKYGRIGDSPLIGAGTWADNKTCAISCTGQGESFIRAVAAYDVAMRLKYTGGALQTAVCETLEQVIKPNGGRGGMIGVTPSGEVAMHFTTKGMYRGVIRMDGIPEVSIYR